METSDVIPAFAALAQERRVDIIRYLVEFGTEGVPAGRIAEHLGVPPQTLAFHLNCLKSAGLVARRRQGRFIIYRAQLDVLASLAGFLLENCCCRQGVACLPAAQTAAARKRATAGERGKCR
jgi:DNA-binding transcriptional ArsR family regulator